MARRLSKEVPADTPIREIQLPPDKKHEIDIKVDKREVSRAIAMGGAVLLSVAVIAAFATQPKAAPSPQAANAQFLGTSIESAEAVVSDITLPKREANQPYTEPEKKAETDPVPQDDENAVPVPEQDEAKPEDDEEAEKATEEKNETEYITEEPSDDEPPVYTQIHSGGVLTKEGGVNTFDGHRETWYSQRVLPGTGLNIPGRHVAEDGTVRDEDDYIVVASDDLPYGSTVETSLGTGKVYDTFGGDNKGTGNVDIYVDW